MTETAQTKPPAGPVDEFAHIPRRRARHPLITLAGALLAFFLVFYGRADLRYALSSGQPLELGNAAALFASGKAATAELENRYSAPATACSSTGWRTRCPPRWRRPTCSRGG